KDSNVRRNFGLTVADIVSNSESTWRASIGVLEHNRKCMVSAVERNDPAFLLATIRVDDWLAIDIEVTLIGAVEVEPDVVGVETRIRNCTGPNGRKPGWQIVSGKVGRCLETQPGVRACVQEFAGVVEVFSGHAFTANGECVRLSAQRII